MSSRVDSIATPLVRGVLGALSSLGIALAVAVVPALAAQVAGTASSATALDAILIPSACCAGHGGGVIVSTGVIEGPVTVTPFGLLLLLMLSALAMRRVGRALRPVRDDGVLRTGALRDVGSPGHVRAGLCGRARGPRGVGAARRARPWSPRRWSPALVAHRRAHRPAVVAAPGADGDRPGVRVLELLPAPTGTWRVPCSA